MAVYRPVRRERGVSDGKPVGGGRSVRRRVSVEVVVSGDGRFQTVPEGINTLFDKRPLFLGQGFGNLTGLRYRRIGK